MAEKSWVLTDLEHDCYIEELVLGADELPKAAVGCSIRKRTLRGGKQQGVDVVEIDNGLVRLVVVPTRGMGVRKLTSGDHTLGWRSPVHGPVHPCYVPLAEESGLGWLDGFDELLVRCGLVSNGAPDFDEQGKLRYPLHGHIANLPAQQVEVAVDDASGAIRVTGVVEEARFHFHKLRLISTITTRPGQPGFDVHDEIVNDSGVAAEAQLLYHVNFGEPLLDAGSRLVAPAKFVVPRNAHAAEGVAGYDSYPAPQPGAEEQVYFFDLVADAEGQTAVLLRNAHGTQGVSLRYNRKQLPCFTQWKNTPATSDGYVTGLEPGTNFPNPRSYEGQQGRMVKLAPGGSQSFDLQLAWHLDSASVAQAEGRLAELSGTTQPKLYDRPQKGWCA